MWEVDHKEGWVPGNWWFWIVLLEKILESPLGHKEIKSVNPGENQPWIFIGRTHAEGEAPILWPPEVKNWLIWKDLDAGKDWKHEEKAITEDEMVGWHHWLNRHEFEETTGDMKDRGDWHAAVVGLQRVGHDLETEQQQEQIKNPSIYFDRYLYCMSSTLLTDSGFCCLQQVKPDKLQGLLQHFVNSQWHHISCVLGNKCPTVSGSGIYDPRAKSHSLPLVFVNIALLEHNLFLPFALSCNFLYKRKCVIFVKIIAMIIK